MLPRPRLRFVIDTTSRWRLPLTKITVSRLAGYAYICWQAGCGRWYEPAIGYFDVVNGARTSRPAPVTCPTHDLPMYEGHFDFTAEAAQLRCPQRYCAAQFKVVVAAPIGSVIMMNTQNYTE